MTQFNSSMFYSTEDFDNSLNNLTIVNPIKIQFIGNTVNYTTKQLKGITSLFPVTEELRSDIGEAGGVQSEIAHGQVVLNHMPVCIDVCTHTHMC